MTVLDASDVTKVFREGSQSVAVLKGASLTVDRGEIVALEGPSGSGKTTFLTILGCMLTPCSGRLSIDGREVDRKRPDLLPSTRVPGDVATRGDHRIGDRWTGGNGGAA